MSRFSIIKEDYVQTNNLKCKMCPNLAYATWYDLNWDEHEYCKSCLEEVEKDLHFYMDLRAAYEEGNKHLDPNDPWFN